jgi:hypothetical protein
LGEIDSLNEDQLSKLASLLNDEDKKVRYKTVIAVGQIGIPAGQYAPQVASLLNDPDELVSKSAASALATIAPNNPDQAANLGSYIQELSADQQANRVKIVAAIEALGIMENTAKEQGPTAAALLLGQNSILRLTSSRALLRMAPLNNETVLLILASTYKHPADINELRLLAHQVADGNEESEILISWLGNSGKKTASKEDIENSPQTLKALMNSWEITKSNKEMTDDLILAIAEVSKNGNWTKDDLTILKKAQDGLKSNGFTDQAEIVNLKISELGGSI